MQNVELRDLHNAYGMFNTLATYDALIDRTKGEERPFILSRSYYAGS